MSAKETLITVVLIGAAAVVAWQSTTPATLMSAADAERIETSVYYAGCNQVRDLGKAPLYAGQPATVRAWTATMTELPASRSASAETIP